MKPLKFVGSSLADIREFPEDARREAGYQRSIGPGVREIRIHRDGEFRVIYVTRLHDTVYVLHAFQKKTQKTSKKDIDAAKLRLRFIQQV